jgi:hypothetical protein
VHPETFTEEQCEKVGGIDEHFIRRLTRKALQGNVSPSGTRLGTSAMVTTAPRMEPGLPVKFERPEY